MRRPQLEGTALVLLAGLGALLVAGALWHRLESATARGAGGGFAADEPLTRHVEIPAGWRLEQVAQALDAASLARAAEFLRVAKDVDAAEAMRVGARGVSSIEGYLLPDAYEIEPGASEHEIAAQMVERFRERFTPAMRRRAALLELSVHDVVTLASLVEREAALYTEKPVIAGVFLNRLRRGMPLQSDPTIVYALDGTRGVPAPGAYWARPLAPRDLYVSSPYNTYLRTGLPPAPIASPGLETIRSVLYPAPVDYVYFVARGDGSHAFARTLVQHERNVERYISRDEPARVGERRGGGELQGLVERMSQTIDGRAGIVVANLATGERGAVGADQYFTTASLYKLYVLAAVYAAERLGHVRLGEHLTISAGLARLDLPRTRASLGPHPTVRHALEHMTALSSNAAGVALLRRVGSSYVERVLRANGIRDTFISRARMITTPRDVARLLELIARGELVDAAASVEMKGLLLRQRINDRLPRYLPKGLPIAHKTGMLRGINHDAGVLYTRAGPVLVVAMLEGVPDAASSSDDIGRLGSSVYRYFTAYKDAARAVAQRANNGCTARALGAGGPLAGRTIVLDPGHGGTDPGAAAHGLLEKRLTLDISFRLRRLLVRRGATVVLTRCRDDSVSLLTRAAIANAVRPDLFVSLHLNSTANRRKDGTEIYFLAREGETVANYLRGSFALPGLWEVLDRRLPLPDRGIHQRRFAVLVHGDPPSVLTESLYMSNPRESRALRTAARRREIAVGHLRGILNYFAAQLPPTRRAHAARRRVRPDARVTIAAVGDIALRTDGDGVFTGVVPSLAADVVVGNLEGALTRRAGAKCVGAGAACFAFRAPPRTAHTLGQAGFTVLNVANNHSLDFGLRGADDTAAAARRAGMRLTGRPGTIALQRAGAVTVAVVGFAPSPGVQSLLDLDSARRLVRRGGDLADVVVVTMHAGAEGNGRAHVRPGPEVYLGSPRGDPIAFAHAVVQAGADLVVGHGPHVLRGLEWYRGRLIAYSLGNFAGTDTLSLRGRQATSAILRATLRADGTLAEARLVPLRLVGDGTPEVDRRLRGVSLVRALSRSDFGPHAPHIGRDGGIAPPVSRARGRGRGTRNVLQAALSPREQASLLVVSGLPAPSGIGGVLVTRATARLPRPAGALAMADQEGGSVRAFPAAPPALAAAAYRDRRSAFAAGREAGVALRGAGVQVDLAPVVDLRAGPLGKRHFRRPELALAFARGLAAGGAAACAKHFPGLGSAPASTDAARVSAELRAAEIAAFRSAVRAGVPCVMVAHAIYPQLGRRPASLERATYRLLRSSGFDGVAVTDALEEARTPDIGAAARRAVTAGADLVLVTDPRNARRAVDALVPLARRGALDEHVARVLVFRRTYGL